MDREQIRLQGDYLKLLENLECDIKNVSGDISLGGGDNDAILIRAINTLIKSSDVGHQKSVDYKIISEKNEKLNIIFKKILNLLVSETEIYCKELEDKIEGLK